MTDTIDLDAKYLDNKGNIIMMTRELDTGKFQGEIVQVNVANVPIQHQGDMVILDKEKFTKLEPFKIPGLETDNLTDYSMFMTWLQAQEPLEAYDSTGLTEQYLEQAGFDNTKHTKSIDDRRELQSQYRTEYKRQQCIPLKQDNGKGDLNLKVFNNLIDNAINEAFASIQHEISQAINADVTGDFASLYYSGNDDPFDQVKETLSNYAKAEISDVISNSREAYAKLLVQEIKGKTIEVDGQKIELDYEGRTGALLLSVPVEDSDDLTIYCTPLHERTNEDLDDMLNHVIELDYIADDGENSALSIPFNTDFESVTAGAKLYVHMMELALPDFIATIKKTAEDSSHSPS